MEDEGSPGGRFKVPCIVIDVAEGPGFSWSFLIDRIEKRVSCGSSAFKNGSKLGFTDGLPRHARQLGYTYAGLYSVRTSRIRP